MTCAATNSGAASRGSEQEQGVEAGQQRGLRDEERGERRVGRLLVAWRTPLPLSRLARATLLLALVLALLLVGCIRIALWCSSLG